MDQTSDFSISASPSWELAFDRWPRADAGMAVYQDQLNTTTQWGQQRETHFFHTHGQTSEPLALDVPAVQAYSNVLQIPLGLPKSAIIEAFPPTESTIVYSTTEWEAKKEVIYKLWIREGRPFDSIKFPHKSVQCILKNEYSFPITKRQFTRKTGEWKFFKNVKWKEMQAIDMLERKRAQLGKKTEIQISERQVPNEKLDCWRYRHDAAAKDTENGTVYVDGLVVSTPKGAQDITLNRASSLDMPRAVPVGEKRLLEDGDVSLQKRMKTGHIHAVDQTSPRIFYSSKLHSETDPMDTIEQTSITVEDKITTDQGQGEQEKKANLHHRMRNDFLLDSMVVNPSLNSETLAGNLNESKIRELDVIGSPKLSRLVAALTLQEDDDVPQFSLDGDEEIQEPSSNSVRCPPRAVLQTPSTQDVDRLGSSAAVSIRALNLASLPCLPRCATLPERPTGPETARTSAWYQREEFKWKRVIVQLHNADAPLARRLPAISKLGLVFKEQYRYAESERLLRHVAVKSSQMFGKTDERTIVAYCDAIQCLLDQGKIRLAAQVSRVLQRGTRIVRTSNHILLQPLLYIEAQVYNGLSKNEEAEHRSRELVQLVLTMDGLSNIQLWKYLQQLAIVMYKKGFLGECEEILTVLLRLAHGGFIKVPLEALYYMRRLRANSFIDQGRVEEGMEHLERVMCESKEIFGIQHPSFLGAQSDLAVCLREHGSHKMAKQFNETALEVCERTFGPYHPLTVYIIEKIRKTCDLLYDLREAVKHDLRLARSYEKSYGLKDVRTLGVFHRLGNQYGTLKLHAESIRWYLKANARYQYLYGIEHPFVTEIHESLAWEYHQSGVYEQSVKWYRKAVAVNEKLGKDYQVVSGLRNLGSHEEASNCWKKIMMIIRKLYYTDYSMTEWTKLREVFDPDLCWDVSYLILDWIY